MAKKFILTKEQTEEAVKKYYSEGRKAAIAYLEELGSKDPLALWNSLKKRMNVTSEGHQKAKKPTLKLDGELRIETPEAHNVDIVETPEKKVGGLCPPPDEDNEFIFQTVAVRNKKLGTFYYDEKHGTIDWRHPYGEEISLYPEDYRLLRDSIDMILHTLGVEL